MQNYPKSLNTPLSLSFFTPLYKECYNTYNGLFELYQVQHKKRMMGVVSNTPIG